jgi:hypothetical protein
MVEEEELKFAIEEKNLGDQQVHHVMEVLLQVLCQESNKGIFHHYKTMLILQYYTFQHYNTHVRSEVLAVAPLKIQVF